MRSEAAIVREIRNYFDCKYAIPVGSGTVGLYLLLRSIGVQDKKVIIPALVCPNVAVSVYAAGGLPVPVDVSPLDYNISVEAIAEAMHADVRAIIAVNSFGYPARIREIKEIAGTFNCTEIEDACQADGGETDNEIIGSRADAGIIIFGYSKPIPLNGGGFVLTDSYEFAKPIIKKTKSLGFRLFAKSRNVSAIELMKTGNYEKMRRLSIESGLLNYTFPCNQYKKLDHSWRQFHDQLYQNQSNLMKVQELLAGCDGIELFKYNLAGWLPWRLSFKISEPENREKFISLAKQEKIVCSCLYKPIAEIFNELGPVSEMPSALHLSKRVVNLCYPMEPVYIEQLNARLERLQHLWNKNLS